MANKEQSKAGEMRSEGGFGWTAKRLFTGNVLSLLVSSQPQEHGLTKLVVAGPLGKLDLSDQNGFDPVAAFHDSRRDALTPASGYFLRQVHEGPASDTKSGLLAIKPSSWNCRYLERLLSGAR